MIEGLKGPALCENDRVSDMTCAVDDLSSVHGSEQGVTEKLSPEQQFREAWIDVNAVLAELRMTKDPDDVANNDRVWADRLTGAYSKMDDLMPLTGLDPIAWYNLLCGRLSHITRLLDEIGYNNDNHTVTIAHQLMEFMEPVAVNRADRMERACGRVLSVVAAVYDNDVELIRYAMSSEGQGRLCGSFDTVENLGIQAGDSLTDLYAFLSHNAKKIIAVRTREEMQSGVWLDLVTRAHRYDDMLEELRAAGRRRRPAAISEFVIASEAKQSPTVGM